MLDKNGQGRWKTLGLVPVLIMAVSIAYLAVFGYGGAVYDPPYLALVLSVLFVLMAFTTVAIISARAYLVSGSVNILLIGAGLLISGLASTVAIWTLDPFVLPNLTSSQTAFIGNVGLLIASFILFLGAGTTWAGKLTIDLQRRKIILATTYLASFLSVAFITILTYSGMFPEFFINAGPTVLYYTVVIASIIFVLTSCLLIGQQYLRLKTPILFWYALALALFGLAFVSAALTVRFADTLNWASRISWYLSGVYFFIAILSLGMKREANVPFHEKWAEAFRSDREQVASFFSNMKYSFVYGRVLTDEDGTPIDYEYLDVNQAYEKENGVIRKDILGKRATEVLPKVFGDPKNVINSCGLVALTGESVDFETYSDVQKRWFHVAVYSPKKGTFVSTIEDITRRREAEDALKQANEILEEKVHERTKDLSESEDRFHTMADNIPQLAWMTDETGWIFWYNKRWFDYTGTTLDEMQGWGWQKVHHPDYVDKVTEKFRQYVEREEAWEDTFPLRGKDGNYRWFLSRAFPIKDKSGKVVRWFGTNTDITEELETQQNLARSNAELQQFAYVASHDLQEPLRMVINYLSLLERRNKGKLDPKSEEYVDFAVKGGERMRELIEDLLAYSRVDTQGMPFAPVDMQEVVAKTLTLLNVSIKESEVDIIVKPLPTIMADESQLLQVMQNLIGNSLKFHGPENPMIRISASQGPRDWIFTVKDNGIGLNMEYAQKIFQMFQRLHTKDKYPGTGVGLAVTKKIIERHGGWIWVESEEGQGATFFFTIPTVAKEEMLIFEPYGKNIGKGHS